MRLLLGGSPCTHWSIAQTKNRETKPEGLGWELFLNYRIARDKFKPDYFLYENNKSISAAIREQITRELGVEPVLINSALVSAQSRQRLYWLGRRMPDGTYTRVEVEQPKDRGILLRDILDSGEAWREKGYTLRASIGMHGGTSSVLKTIKEPGKFAFNGKAEPIRIGTIESGSHTTHDSKPFRVYSPDGKTVTQQGEAGGYGAKTGLYAVPMRVGDMPNARGKINGSQSGRVYDVEGKGVPLQARPNGGGADGATTGLYALPTGLALRGRDNVSHYEKRDDGKANAVIVGHQSRLCIEPMDCNEVPCATGRVVGRRINEDGHRDDHNESLEHVQRVEVNSNSQKTNCLTTVAKDNVVIVPTDCPALRVSEATARGYTDIFPGECVDLTMPNNKTRRGRAMREKSNCLTTSCQYNQYCGTVDKPIYEVKDGQITITGKQYPIKLADGYYIIRKLTVTECKRLQTVPDDYIFPVSDTQAYKMLGNGWTVDVIAHLLSHILGICSEPVTVLSMYDGMSCGHIALDKLGAKVERYYATEIDKWAIKTTQANYPDTVQLGDAFAVREEYWRLK